MSRLPQTENDWDQVVAHYQSVAAEVADDVWDRVFGASPPTFRSKTDGGKAVALVLTANVANNQYSAEIDGVEVWLTGTLFGALVQLVEARLTAGANGLGLTKLGGMDSKDSVHQTIRRLRKAIDVSVGIEGFGAELIQHKAKSEYSLAVPPECLFADRRLLELAPSHISEAAAQAILALAVPLAR